MSTWRHERCCSALRSRIPSRRSQSLTWSETNTVAAKVVAPTAATAAVPGTIYFVAIAAAADAAAASSRAVVAMPLSPQVLLRYCSCIVLLLLLVHLQVEALAPMNQQCSRLRAPTGWIT